MNDPLTLCLLGKFFMLFCRLLNFSKSTVSKNYFRNTIRVSNSLEPDPNCLQKLLAEDTSRQKVNYH